MIFFMVLFLLIILVGFGVARFGKKMLEERETSPAIFKAIGWTGVGLLVFLFVVNSITVIDSGEVGIKILFGKAQKSTIQEGINIVNPFADVRKYSIRIREYTMDRAAVRTINNMEVSVDVSIWFRINKDKAYEIYRNIAKNENALHGIIITSSRSAVRSVASTYKDFDSLNKKREEFAKNVLLSIQEKLSNKGVLIDKVLIRNVSPPKELETAINAKLQRQQQIEEMQYKLKIAKKEAQIKVVEAKGIAQAQQIINRTLTYNYLQFEAIKAQKAMAKSPNHTTIYIPSGANGIPLVRTMK